MNLPDDFYCNLVETTNPGDRMCYRAESNEWWVDWVDDVTGELCSTRRYFVMGAQLAAKERLGTLAVQNAEARELQRRMSAASAEDAASAKAEIEQPRPPTTTPAVDEATERKRTPVYSGVLRYFPDAIKAIARCSFAGNEQHNPGTPLHWDRAKSGDELDALMRHLIDDITDPTDKDGIRHLTKVAWRALAALQKAIEDSDEKDQLSD